MSEVPLSPELEPVSNPEQAQRLYQAIIEDRQSHSAHAGLFHGEQTWTKKTQDGKLAVKLFPDDSGFRDHNYEDPSKRILASVTNPAGHEYAVWNMGESVEGEEANLELLVCRDMPPELRSKIRGVRMASIAQNVLNHLTTYGVFIGGVEAERRQRRFEAIQNLKEAYGVVEQPTNEEVDQLLESFKTRP